MVHCLTINLPNNVSYNVIHAQSNTGIKRYVMNEDSSMLWHWRLRHIFIEMIKILVNDGVLNTLDFINFHICVGCIKGKADQQIKEMC